jgi:DNA-binding HxlR family transcriptional regulator
VTRAANFEAPTGREISDAVSYAIGHGIRIEILAILNEGLRTQTELTRRLGLTQSKLQHHLAEMVKDGSIEEVEGRHIGNLVERHYRALRKAEYSAEDYRDMPEETRRLIVGLTLQNTIAEHLAAFRGGEMKGEDPNLTLTWDWFNVDEKGKEELTAELAQSWKRLKAIEARSAVRRGQSKEDGQSVIISSIAHPRVRPAPGGADVQLIDADRESPLTP